MSKAKRTRKPLLALAGWTILGWGCSAPPETEPQPETPAQAVPSPSDRAAARRSNAPGARPAVQPEPGPGRTGGVEALRLQLIAMAGNDQEIRSRIFSKPVGDMTKQERDQLEALDKANSARLQEIIDTQGWPGKSLVGEEAANAAFLILQHAPPDLQTKALPLLERAYRQGEAEGEQLALLTDRVRVAQGRPQLYGTQVLFSSDGQLKVEPIEDKPRLDQRRAELGLPPHEEYLRTLKQAYQISRLRRIGAGAFEVRHSPWACSRFQRRADRGKSRRQAPSAIHRDPVSIPAPSRPTGPPAVSVGGRTRARTS